MVIISGPVHGPYFGQMADCDPHFSVFTETGRQPVPDFGE
jgi:hypothetical protein